MSKERLQNLRKRNVEAMNKMGDIQDIRDEKRTLMNKKEMNDYTLDNAEVRRLKMLILYNRKLREFNSFMDNMREAMSNANEHTKQLEEFKNTIEIKNGRKDILSQKDQEKARELVLQSEKDMSLLKSILDEMEKVLSIDLTDKAQLDKISTNDYTELLGERVQGLMIADANQIVSLDKKACKRFRSVINRLKAELDRIEKKAKKKK